MFPYSAYGIEDAIQWLKKERLYNEKYKGLYAIHAANLFIERRSKRSEDTTNPVSDNGSGQNKASGGESPYTDEEDSPTAKRKRQTGRKGKSKSRPAK